MERIRRAYGVTIESYFPRASRSSGSRARRVCILSGEHRERKECCFIARSSREPAREGLDVWISGLRREQAVNARSDRQARGGSLPSRIVQAQTHRGLDGG